MTQKSVQLSFYTIPIWNIQDDHTSHTSPKWPCFFLYFTLRKRIHFKLWKTSGICFHMLIGGTPRLPNYHRSLLFTWITVIWFAHTPLWLGHCQQGAEWGLIRPNSPLFSAAFDVTLDKLSLITVVLIYKMIKKSFKINKLFPYLYIS